MIPLTSLPCVCFVSVWQGVVVYALFECWRKQANKRGIYQVQLGFTKTKIIYSTEVIVGLAFFCARRLSSRSAY